MVSLGLEKPAGGFNSPNNGPKVHFIVPRNHKLSFWYKQWYARASRLERARATAELLHVR